MLKSFQYKKNDYDKLPLMLVLLGYNHEQEPVYRTLGVPMYQFFYCKKGQGQLIVENRKYDIRKGQCFFISKDTPHEYYCTGKELILSMVGFIGPIAPILLRTLKLNSSGAYLLKSNGNFLKHIDNIYKMSEGKTSEIRVALSQELYCLLTDLTSELTQVKSESADYGNPTITQVIEYIESHYSEDISLDTLAQLSSRTPEYLCSIFKKHTGVTIINYINNMRLLQATIALIQNPSKPVSEIATDCGFRSPSYFGKMFLKQYGQSPQQYRLERI